MMIWKFLYKATVIVVFLLIPGRAMAPDMPHRDVSIHTVRQYVGYLENETVYMESRAVAKAEAVLKILTWRHINESRNMYRDVSCGDCPQHK